MFHSVQCLTGLTESGEYYVKFGQGKSSYKSQAVQSVNGTCTWNTAATLKLKNMENVKFKIKNTKGKLVAFCQLKLFQIDETGSDSIQLPCFSKMFFDYSEVDPVKHKLNMVLNVLATGNVNYFSLRKHRKNSLSMSSKLSDGDSSSLIMKSTPVKPALNKRT